MTKLCSQRKHAFFNLSMKAECPHCKFKIKAPDEYLGKKARCPKCHQSFVVNKSQTGPVPMPENDEAKIPTKQAHPEYTNHEIGSRAAEKMAISFNIPHKFQQYLHKDEVVLFASNSSTAALVLNLVIPVIFLLLNIPALFVSVIAFFFGEMFWSLVCLFIYLSWKNRFYIITDTRTYAAEGVLNHAISLIPNKSIQMVCINTGIIDKLLGMNTLEISSAAQGGTNIFHAFVGKTKGSIKLRYIAEVHEALAVYHEVFA